MWKRVLIGVFLIVVVAATYMVVKIGPRNVIGMLLYDQRREGSLVVGDPAPDVELVSLSGETSSLWAEVSRDKPLVLIFGSFT